MKIVYDRTYPPTTVDYTPIVRAVQASNPEIVYVASYPPDTVGIIHAVTEIGLKTNMLGGAFVGLPTAALKTQLGPQMNGIVNVELWEPVPTMEFPGIMDFLKKYQARAAAEGVDPLGYFLPPFAYSELQILGAAVEATKSSRRGYAGPIHPWSHLPHDRRRHRLRRGRRMDRGTANLGAIPRHQEATAWSSSNSPRRSRSLPRRNTRPAT